MSKLAANTDKKSEQELKEVIKEAKMKTEREQIKKPPGRTGSRQQPGLVRPGV